MAEARKIKTVWRSQPTRGGRRRVPESGVRVPRGPDLDPSCLLDDFRPTTRPGTFAGFPGIRSAASETNHLHASTARWSTWTAWGTSGVHRSGRRAVDDAGSGIIPPGNAEGAPGWAAWAGFQLWRYLPRIAVV